MFRYIAAAGAVLLSSAQLPQLERMAAVPLGISKDSALCALRPLVRQSKAVPFISGLIYSLAAETNFQVTLELLLH